MHLLKKHHSLSEGSNYSSLSARLTGGQRAKSVYAEYYASHRKKTILLVSLAVLLLVSMVFSACIGAVNIPLGDLADLLLKKLGVEGSALPNEQFEAVLFSLRLPRVLQSVIVGVGLAVSGATIQGLFRNPLAEPGLVGISAGASLFAIIVIVLGNVFFSSFMAGFGHYSLALSAFAGGCITAFVVYRISVHNGRSDIATLLLAGIAINALSGAVIGVLTYLSDDVQLRNITFWSLGSLGGASWSSVAVLSIFVGIPLVVVSFFSKALDVFALGEAQAAHAGVNIQLVKRTLLILTTLSVGASVAMCGIIGFVGLVIPHMVRLFAGSSHRHLIPSSALLGGAVLTVADLIARTLVMPAELPIGIVTALLGSPVFIYMIFKEKRARKI